MTYNSIINFDLGLPDKQRGIQMKMFTRRFPISLLTLAIFLTTTIFAQTKPQVFDVLIKNGTVYDGTGQPGKRVDVGIRADKIAAIGDLSKAKAQTIIDAKNLAVAPGFINMLSWSTESLIVDGRSLGELKQGVTTQIMGEGWSMKTLGE